MLTPTRCLALVPDEEDGVVVVVDLLLLVLFIKAPKSVRFLEEKERRKYTYKAPAMTGGTKTKRWYASKRSVAFEAVGVAMADGGLSGRGERERDREPRVSVENQRNRIRLEKSQTDIQN